MSTLATRLGDLATRIATECKSLRTLMNGNATDNSALTTTTKTNLVAAINELKSSIDTLEASGGAIINDASDSSTTETWSIDKISASQSDAISAAITGLLNGAPGALDTLKELADAIGDDANFAGTVTAALGNRVRTDTAAQGLTTTQQQNARTNINAYGSVELGDPDTNLVTVFTTGLV